jgi:hypothetical protein
VPVLDLPEGPPILPGDMTLFSYTFPVMLYPRDERGRAHWSAAATIEACIERIEAGASPEILRHFYDSVRFVWNLNQAPRRIFEDGLARVHRGLLSGQVLQYLLVTTQHNQRHCRVERAKAFIAEYPLPGAQAASESLIEKAWAEFKTVSHLWAAQIAMVSATGHPDHQSDRAWIEVLGLAEEFRRQGQNARFLPPEEMWTVPAGLVPAKELPIGRLNPERLSFLDSMFPGQ